MKLKTVAVALIASLGAMSAQASAPTNLIQNGGFESSSFSGTFATYAAGNPSLTNWTINFGSVDLINNYWQASSGNYSLDLSGSSLGAISQQFATTNNQLYHVSFDMAGNPDDSDKLKTLMVSLSGTPFYTFDATGKSRTNMGWTTYGFDFYATGANSTLAFTSMEMGPYGPALDNISVTAIPEPETYAMFLAGLGLMGFMSRRRSIK